MAENEALKERVDRLEAALQSQSEHARTSHPKGIDALTANSEIIEKQRQIEEYEQRIEELTAKQLKKEQENHLLRRSMDELAIKLKRKQTLKSVHSESYDAEEFQNQIERLKLELSAAQRTIIEMTSVVGVQQTFPTVQETMQQYRSIRDQV